MGWCYYGAKYWRNGRIDRKRECEELIGDELVHGSLVGSVYYAAVRNKNTGEVWGLVILTSQDGYEFGYKDMSEDMGPYNYDCPECILKLLSPTDNEWANKWRQKCREQAKRKKEFDKLPIGTKLAVPGNWTHGGSEIVVTKYDNSRTGWRYSVYYVSKSLIMSAPWRIVTDEYEKRRSKVEQLLVKYTWSDKPYKRAYLNVALSMSHRYGVPDTYVMDVLGGTKEYKTALEDYCA